MRARPGELTGKETNFLIESRDERSTDSYKSLVSKKVGLPFET